MKNDSQDKIRFGNYAHDIKANYSTISYSDLTKDAKPYKSDKIKLRSIDIYRHTKPYISVRFMEQVFGLLPLAIYLALFQVILLRQSISDASTISVGLLAVILGLMFFMEGIKLGLMPFGEIIGNMLPKKVSLKVVLLIAFLLGIGVTFAEPAIGALKAAGSLVEVEKAPYLYAMLNQYSDALVLIVGIGVGFAAIFGTIRFIYNWSLKPFIYISLSLTTILTLYVMLDSNLVSILGLAWDSGAVTTGPVTVPLVLALGIGIAGASGSANNSLSGFGIVTLASIFPVIGVMGLGIYLSFVISPQEIITVAQLHNIDTQILPWYSTTPAQEIVLGIRAIVPLVIFLLIVLKIILKTEVENAGTIIYGITLAVLGMIIFNIGLTYGLAKLGAQAGSLIPSAFNTVTSADGTIIDALYPYAVGLGIAILFAWVLGFGATLAEPALNALGMTVENLTQGVFKKITLMYAVSIGVGTGISLGIVKIIFSIPLGYLILPLYSVAIMLTYFSKEEYVNIAWDSAGVTTGPITVPLVLAMGLGFGNAVGSVEGFGILSMASIGPIISVLLTGLWIDKKHKEVLL